MYNKVLIAIVLIVKFVKESHAQELQTQVEAPILL
ncbi:hypothetical protein SAMN05421797_109106 [Maribacter ulvicola]|uniref:Uncharacterized protein n=1 Tax=Maribacter ulvicola TaxID=228959 RepID=A0A1N6ZSL3_9FLAO|nr:hypothetical protein SAMN05421797_109106 [Maribacter ulvicola]